MCFGMGTLIKARRGSRIPWSWSYRWFAAVTVGGCWEQTAEPAFRSHIKMSTDIHRNSILNSPKPEKGSMFGHRNYNWILSIH